MGVVPEGVVGVEGVWLVVGWALLSVRPAYRWDKSAVSETMTSDKWCGKCDYTVTSWQLLSWFPDR